MKKCIILSSLLWSAMAFAAPSAYDITLLGGVVFPDSDTKLENQTVIGGAVQYNGFDFPFAPELQVLQSLETDFKAYPGDTTGVTPTGNGSTFVNRILLNGVHDFDLGAALTPYAKLGIGYESFYDYDYFENRNSMIADAGAGLKYAFSDNWSARIEGLAMHKFHKRNDFSFDNNFGLLAGVTYSFGSVASRNATAAENPAPAAAAAATEQTAAPAAPAAAAAAAASTATVAAAEAVTAPLDSDGDGVADAADKCPGSVKGFAVDADGCEVTPVFTFSFQINKADVPTSIAPKYKKYGEYIKRNNLNLKVVGHTDSTGTAAYNMKLSERRAQNVAKIIESAGVPAGKITVEGKGETQPLMSNKTPEGRAANRRVELIPSK